MRWLVCALALVAILVATPVPSGAESTPRLAISENAQQATSMILARYLNNGAQAQSVNMTRLGAREINRGAECPGGSGRYCSNALPYCCRAANGSIYCAPNAGGCSR